MRLSVPLCLCGFLSLIVLAQHSQAAADPAFEAQLKTIDDRVSKIQDYTARFEQQKFTALLRKPLTSTGSVKVLGAVVRWDTEKPDPAVLHSDGKEFRLYFPKQKMVEVYPIDKRMSDMVASPLPRLSALRESFAFEKLAPSDMKPDAPDLAEGPNRLALRLKPINEQLKNYLSEVRVLLDSEAAFMLCVVTVDADGDRTVIRFKDVRLNTGLKPADVALTVPPDTKISRPLESAGGK